MELKDSITLEMSITLFDNFDFHGLYAADTS